MLTAEAKSVGSSVINSRPEAPTPSEPGLCGKLDEALGYASELASILSQMEIKLRRGAEKYGEPEKPLPGAFGSASALSQRLAGLVGFARTLNGML